MKIQDTEHGWKYSSLVGEESAGKQLSTAIGSSQYTSSDIFLIAKYNRESAVKAGFLHVRLIIMVGTTANTIPEQKLYMKWPSR